MALRRGDGIVSRRKNLPKANPTDHDNGGSRGHGVSVQLRRNKDMAREPWQWGWFLCVLAAVVVLLGRQSLSWGSRISNDDGGGPTGDVTRARQQITPGMPSSGVSADVVLNNRDPPSAGREQEVLRKERTAKGGTTRDPDEENASGLRRRQRRWPSEANMQSMGIIDGAKSLERGVRRRDNLLPAGKWFRKKRHRADYGDLEILALREGERRKISVDSHFNKKVQINDIDGFEWHEYYDQYDMYDDDGIRSDLFTRENDNDECRQPSWFRLHFPTCNSFHEMRIIHADADNRYLGKGFFRMTFLLKEKEQPEAVIKVNRWKEGSDTFLEDRYEKTRMDALVMERLTSSPRITDMYGHCATSLITESLPVEVWGEAVPVEREIRRKDLHDRHDVDPKNRYTPTEKITMALDMAEALADLHGFEDGMIVHDDLDLGQYLRAMPGGKIKLNDFNRAKPLLWDSSKQKYCKYYNGKIGGKFRAPEEFVPTILDEKIDIFSLGNCFYGLLTGLWPHYLDESKPAQKKLMNGEMPFIDERYRARSYAEGKLVEAIEMCHHRKPKRRSDVFAIVNHLRSAVEENNRRRAE